MFNSTIVLDVDVFGCVCFWLDFKRSVKDMLPFKFVCNSIVHFRYTKNVIEEFLAASSGCMCWFIENFNPKLKFCASMLNFWLSWLATEWGWYPAAD